MMRKNYLKLFLIRNYQQKLQENVGVSC